MNLAEINHLMVALPWQQASWLRLIERLQAGRMPHALLLRGEPGTGKGQFALALGQYLLCQQPVANTACGKCKGCLLNLAGTHPDLAILEPEEPGRAIKVDQIRAVVQFVGKTAQLGGYRVMVLGPAESMNANASNALLKSLEEPGERTLLILVSDQISGVLPTIRSRCEVMEFGIPDRSVAKSWLLPQIGDDNKVEKLLNVAGGAPCRALSLDQSEWLGERVTVVQQWLGVLTGKRDAVRTADGWMQYPLKELLNWLQAWQVDLARLVSGSQQPIHNQDLEQDLHAAAAVLNVNQLFFCYEHLLNVKRLIASQANPNTQLLLEELLLKWSQAAKR
ncbi:DNA polymerase III subunit delta' [Ketobacter sp. MCCC 1A13808]|uniref:DNA polymerase III subunit delta' n=1 Tax=Ketobacter sp. MCCC 1A13808 TaxID=2602738 RepID=UPI000F248311|nr:DNA polymerase III subunit delta' [Ketobacter sp. MCCC 1A13808]MVF10680.1 DNA polymerase III subunit delta' [Ketobacter sp. MCCC 1A13808]RLP56099.1 MAG: DNA polymerase III subunit delta' [Ketobacter sp.]